ncbi:hypothetical protein [Halococcus salifodinae]|nr:hypothetical protein [Halococcus salifodinae]
MADSSGEAAHSTQGTLHERCEGKALQLLESRPQMLTHHRRLT